MPSDLILDGVDLLPYLKGENADSPHDAFYWSNGPNKAVRLANWKLIIAGDHGFPFNLDSDLGEMKEWRNQIKPPAWPSKPNRRKVDIDGVPYELNI